MLCQTKYGIVIIDHPDVIRTQGAIKDWIRLERARAAASNIPRLPATPDDLRCYRMEAPTYFGGRIVDNFQSYDAWQGHGTKRAHDAPVGAEEGDCEDCSADAAVNGIDYPDTGPIDPKSFFFALQKCPFGFHAVTCAWLPTQIWDAADDVEVFTEFGWLSKGSGVSLIDLSWRRGMKHPILGYCPGLPGWKYDIR